jgi:hypothetical protein
MLFLAWSWIDFGSPMTSDRLELLAKDIPLYTICRSATAVTRVNSVHCAYPNGRYLVLMSKMSAESSKKTRMREDQGSRPVDERIHGGYCQQTRFVSDQQSGH